MNEIGSEFWKDEIPCGSDSVQNPWVAWPGKKQFYLSGRTALYAVIDDIVAALPYKKPLQAYLPSYCCETMIDPFLMHGIDVSFYPVLIRDGRLVREIDSSKVCDIVLVLDYFGYASQDRAFPDGAVVVRDMTHALLSSNAESKLNYSDYAFASFRKWANVAGAGVACKREGKWREKPRGEALGYIDARNRGYELKAGYMAGEQIAKDAYLQVFDAAERLLKNDYVGYQADQASLDTAATLLGCKGTRRRNAECLLAELNEVQIAKPLFSHVSQGDAPLFVPVFVPGGLRDSLRQFLIENRVYCPVHWPVSEMHKLTDEEMQLYSSELSLICDQRYGLDDMKRQAALLKAFESRC